MEGIKAPAKRCTRSNCPGKVRNGICDKCGSLRSHTSQQYDKFRGTPTERGYDYRWTKLRLIVLQREPLCRECMKNNIVTQATEVDHIIAKRNGGKDSFDNLQSLCKSCHSMKTASGN